MGALNLSLIIRAVDRASGVVRKVTGGIGRMTEGVGRFTRAAVKMAAIGMAAIVAVGAAAFVAGRRLFDMVESAAAAGDAAFNNSKKVGVSIREYQRLAYAAKLSNLAQEELGVGLKFLAVNASSAAKGGKLDAEAFRQLGVRVKGANGQVRPVADMLGEIADRFAGMADGPAKVALAMQIFGRSGTEMIPFLNEGAAGIRRMGDEAERLGIVMGDDAARGSDEFNDKVDALKASLFGLKMAIGIGLLPTITRYVEKLTAFIAAHRPEIVKAFTEGVLKIGAALGKIDLGQLIGDIATLISGLATFVRFVGGMAGLFDTVVVAGIANVGWVIGSVAAAIATALGFAAAPVVLVVAAITALVAAGYFLWRNWDKVCAAVGGAVAGLAIGIVRFIRHAVAVMAGAAIAIGKAWRGMASFFTGLWTRIGAAFKAGVASIWNALPSWMRTLLAGIGKGVAFTFKLLGGGPPAATGGAAGGPGPRAPGSPGPAIPAMPRLGPPRAPGTAGVGLPGFQRQSWDGKLTVELQGDQAARVRSVRSSNNDFDLLVDRGLNLGAV